MAVRLLPGGAALFALVIGTLGCSSAKDAGSTLPPIASQPAATVTTIAAGSETLAPSAAPGSSTTTIAINAPTLLNTALDSLGAGYHFTNTVTVDGVVALTADGDRVGDGTRVGVVRDDVSVRYIITPQGTWVQPEGGEWEQIEAPATATDPIAALRAPTAVEVANVNGTAATLSVTVPATSLGINADGSVIVSTVIDGGTIKQVVYNTTVDGHPATVQAEIGAVVDGSPVVPPA